MKRVFISFDYDNDSALKEFLVGQAKNPDSPFEIADYSIKEELPGDWKEKARRRISNVDVVAVICGEHTDIASGVNAEVKITQDEEKPYFLLDGYKERNTKKPRTARENDKMYSWTWENLTRLIMGAR